MPVNVGDRVIALRNAVGSEKKAYSYGAGVYKGEQIVEHIPELAGSGIKNPCIELDDGAIVYGMECWWGPEEAVKKRFEGFEFIQVSITAERGAQP